MPLNHPGNNRVQGIGASQFSFNPEPWGQKTQTKFCCRCSALSLYTTGRFILIQTENLIQMINNWTISALRFHSNEPTAEWANWNMILGKINSLGLKLASLSLLLLFQHNCLLSLQVVVRSSSSFLCLAQNQCATVQERGCLGRSRTTSRTGGSTRPPSSASSRTSRRTPAWATRMLPPSLLPRWGQIHGDNLMWLMEMDRKD